MIINNDEMEFYTEEIPYLLKIKKCEKVNKEQKIATFLTEDNEKINLPYKVIADPSYDTTFKKLFYDNSPSKNYIKGKTRLINFINGILFPNVEDNGLKVREIMYLPNEVVAFSNRNRKGTFIFDVPFVCKCWDIEHKKNAIETIFGVDVEMQIKYQKNFTERFYRYNASLSSHYQQPFVVFSLLNFKEKTTLLNIFNSNNTTFNIKEKAIGLGPSFFDGESKPISLFDEINYNTYFLDLKNNNENFSNKHNLKINNANINNTAKAWLKLFSLRYWSLKEERNALLDKFVIPADENYLDEELKDAIEILELISNDELSNAMIEQDDILATYKNEREEGREEEREKFEEERKKEREKFEEERKKEREEGRKEGREEGRKEEREKLKKKEKKKEKNLKKKEKKKEKK